jgi:NAD(P)-dependent dehydrogenase (short-subunit alcohol dehydrogenase family)
VPGKLERRVAVITGAGTGIGRGTALVLAEHGARVAAVDIDRHAADETSALLRSNGGEALAIEADVSRASTVQQMVAAVVEHWGRLDILVNNAGIIRYGTVVDTEEETWDALLAVDLKGCFLCSKYAISAMREHGAGSIVNVASAMAIAAFPQHAAYCAAKAGVIGLTKAMALDHAREGIRVNCVCPGTVQTALNMRNYDATTLELIAQCHPLGRLGTPEEIGQTIAFLASEESAFLTGAVLVADGGLSSQLGPDILSATSPIRQFLKKVLSTTS